MNARQKAKHFKKLYEQSLYKSTVSVVYKTVMPTHYRISELIDNSDIAYAQDFPQLFKTHIENNILQKLRPLISQNLKTEKDFYSDKSRYYLDVWFEL